mgnify:FL=1|jgi:hypothetical protein
MQKLKLKDYLQTMSHPSKIFDIEVIIDDMVYVGKEIRAKDKEAALKIMSIMSGGEVTTQSEIIHLQERMVH